MGLRFDLFYLLLYILLGFVHSENWAHYTVLDGNGVFHLYWNSPEDESSDSKITFKVKLKARGFFGLGFSPNGGMPGSDIVTGWIKDGEIYFQDRHALTYDVPIKDPQQDYELINAYENETFTVFEFRRRLDTCDENDTVINDNTMRVIYAYSEEDPESDDPLYHGGNRGTKSILLLQNEVNKNSDLNLTSLLTWDIISPNVNISSIDTLYWCKIYRSPQLSEKHHIVSIKPVIQEGHAQFVHHMLMLECIGGIPEQFEKYVDDSGYECYRPEMPADMLKCGGTFTTWAVGGQGITFPDQAGLTLNSGPGTYFLLEIHYDNPRRVTGIVDHSGLRYYYTPDLRESDAGDFQIGASFIPRFFIPPGQKEYILVSHSSEECFGSTFPASGIKAFAVFPHAHLLGRAVKARHFRGNEELTPLVDDKGYDFHFQEYRYFAKEVEILPGDQITVECIFDSSERTNVTLGGLSTRDEMCLIHILYYPRVTEFTTHSAPTYASINEALKTNITKDADIYDVLGNYNWSSVDIRKVENAMRYSAQETQCFFGEFQADKVYPLRSYPQDLIPYVPESTCNVIM